MNQVIQCPSCSTKFAINASQLQHLENPRFHCSRCNTIFGLLDHLSSDLDTKLDTKLDPKFNDKADTDLKINERETPVTEPNSDSDRTQFSPPRKENIVPSSATTQFTEEDYSYSYLESKQLAGKQLDLELPAASELSIEAKDLIAEEEDNRLRSLQVPWPEASSSSAFEVEISLNSATSTSSDPLDTPSRNLSGDSLNNSMSERGTTTDFILPSSVEQVATSIDETQKGSSDYFSSKKDSLLSLFTRGTDDRRNIEVDHSTSDKHPSLHDLQQTDSSNTWNFGHTPPITEELEEKPAEPIQQPSLRSLLEESAPEVEPPPEEAKNRAFDNSSGGTLGNPSTEVQSSEQNYEEEPPTSEEKLFNKDDLPEWNNDIGTGISDEEIDIPSLEINKENRSSKHTIFFKRDEILLNPVLDNENDKDSEDSPDFMMGSEIGIGSNKHVAKSPNKTNRKIPLFSAIFSSSKSVGLGKSRGADNSVQSSLLSSFLIAWSVPFALMLALWYFSSMIDPSSSRGNWAEKIVNSTGLNLGTIRTAPPIAARIVEGNAYKVVDKNQKVGVLISSTIFNRGNNPLENVTIDARLYTDQYTMISRKLITIPNLLSKGAPFGLDEKIEPKDISEGVITDFLLSQDTPVSSTTPADSSYYQYIILDDPGVDFRYFTVALYSVDQKANKA